MAFSIFRVLTDTWWDWMAVDIADGDDDALRELVFVDVLVVDVGGMGEEWRWCNLLRRIFCGELFDKRDEL